MGNLLPSEALIYERSDGVVYARYRDPPFNKIPRWEIGSDVDLESTVNYSTWCEILKLAKENETLNTQLKQLLTVYTLCKEPK